MWLQLLVIRNLIKEQVRKLDLYRSSDRRRGWAILARKRSSGRNEYLEASRWDLGLGLSKKRR